MFGLHEYLTLEFVLLSLIFIVLGEYLKSGYNIAHFFKPDMDQSLRRDAESLGITLDEVRVVPVLFLGPIGNLILKFGVISAVASCLNIIAWKTQNSFVMWFNVVVEIVLFLAIFLVPLSAKIKQKEVEELILSHEDMSKSLQDYMGVLGNNDISDTMNAVMGHYQCCGFLGVDDFKNLPKWPRAINDTSSSKLATPFMCCKVKSLNHTCAQKGHVNEKNNWMLTGCYQRLNETLEQNYGILLFILSYILTLLILIVINLNICGQPGVTVKPNSSRLIYRSFPLFPAFQEEFKTPKMIGLERSSQPLFGVKNEAKVIKKKVSKKKSLHKKYSSTSSIEWYDSRVDPSTTTEEEETETESEETEEEDEESLEETPKPPIKSESVFKIFVSSFY